MMKRKYIILFIGGVTLSAKKLGQEPRRRGRKGEEGGGGNNLRIYSFGVNARGGGEMVQW